jgi:probable rRNA maturation factor
MSFEIDISNRQQVLSVDCDALQAALERTLELEHVASAVLSVSIVDNAAIHILNRHHLSHDYPTDVISFQLDFHESGDDLSDEFDDDDDVSIEGAGEDGEEEEIESFANESDASDLAEKSSSVSAKELRASGAFLEGEIIASAEMANSMAADGRWSAQAELTLYVVHGLLHICGYDDLTPEEQQIMRSRERAILKSLGLTAVYAED